jgi:hypothetical protein
MTIRTMCVAAAIILGAHPVAMAQPSIGARAYLTYGTTSFAAADTFEAVGAASRQSGLGGGGTVTGLWHGLFADVAVSQQKVNGERAFINNGNVYHLGIPLSIKMRPVDVAAGWRFARGRVSPYAGGGMTFISYTEQGAFAEAGDDVSDRASGGLFLGGADVAVIKWITVGGEVRYRAVSGVLGNDGISQVVGDDQLGGLSASLRISVGR